MQKVESPVLWRSVFTFTPFTYDLDFANRIRENYPDFHPDDLLPLPGVCVKSGYTPGKGFSRFGRLAKFMGDPFDVELPGKKQLTEDVVVLSTEDQFTVWLGGVTQYFDMWCVD